MLPIATDVARSVVCLSVCWSHGCAMQERLNLSRCRLRVWLRWAQGTMNSMGIEIPLWELTILGSCPAHWKALGVSAAVCAAKGIIQSRITAWQPTAMLPTGRCHITLSPVKNPPLQCGLLSKLFDYMLPLLSYLSLFVSFILHCKLFVWVAGNTVWSL